MDEHVYYWAWAEEDNPGYSYFGGQNGKWYRVFKAGGKGTPITEPMSRSEAIKYCRHIVKLTGGRELL